MAKAKTQAANGNSAAPEMVNAMMVVNPAAAKVWGEIMSEGMRFMADRWQHDMDTQKAMMACRTPVELMGVQMDFVQKAVGQYGESAMRMYSIMSAAGEDMSKGSWSSFSRKYDDVPI